MQGVISKCISENYSEYGLFKETEDNHAWYFENDKVELKVVKDTLWIWGRDAGSEDWDLYDVAEVA